MTQLTNAGTVCIGTQLEAVQTEQWSSLRSGVRSSWVADHCNSEGLVGDPVDEV